MGRWATVADGPLSEEQARAIYDRSPSRSHTAGLLAVAREAAAAALEAVADVIAECPRTYGNAPEVLLTLRARAAAYRGKKL